MVATDHSKLYAPEERPLSHGHGRQDKRTQAIIYWGLRSWLHSTCNEDLKGGGGVERCSEKHQLVRVTVCLNLDRHEQVALMLGTAA